MRGLGLFSLSPLAGQGNRIWVNKDESLLEQTESKSSEIPVLFTHMRFPCPQAGEGIAACGEIAASGEREKSLPWRCS